VALVAVPLLGHMNRLVTGRRLERDTQSMSTDRTNEFTYRIRPLAFAILYAM